ncbi:MAG: hypothetical protein ACRD0L_08830, partial [Acidimicrobiales bacterium]
MSADGLGPGPAEHEYRAGGFAFRVRADAPEVATLLDRLLAPFRASEGETDRTPVTYHVTGHPEAPDLWSASWGGDQDVTRIDLPTMVDRIMWEVTQGAIGAGAYLALHSGAVSWQDRAVLLPAPSGSGKSTLAAGLTWAGCSYLTDELAMVDPETAHVVPFPRPLWMVPASIELLPG